MPDHALCRPELFIIEESGSGRWGVTLSYGEGGAPEAESSSGTCLGSAGRWFCPAQWGPGLCRAMLPGAPRTCPSSGLGGQFIAGGLRLRVALPEGHLRA